MPRKLRVQESNDNNRVTPFPPLPPIPAPPRLPHDSRQCTVARIVGVLADVAETDMNVAGPNLTKGFYASAVDVGQLQAELAHGISRLSLAQLDERWDEVFDWIGRVLRSWVQRCKQMRIVRHEGGIRIEFETQDDHGYYKYGFDVVPRKQSDAR